MLTFNTFNFTAEQIAQIDRYRSKWEQIAVLKEPIDRERVKLAINKAYKLIDLSQPNTLFFATPYEALNYLNREITANWGKLNESFFGKPVAGDLIDRLIGNIRKEIKKELLERLRGNLDNGLADSVALETTARLQTNQIFTIIMANFRAMAIASNKESDADAFSKLLFELFLEAGFVVNNFIFPALWQIENLFHNRVNNTDNTLATFLTGRFNRPNSTRYELPFIDANSRFINAIIPSVMTDFAYYIDYCHEVLNCDRDAQKWDVFYDLITGCGWLFPYENIVLICDR